MSATTSKAHGTFLLAKQGTNTFTIDLTLSAGCGTQTDPNNPLNIQAYGGILRGGWTFGVTIRRAGTLRMEMNPAWYGVGYCRSGASGFFDVRSTDNPNNVMSARVGANTQLIWTGNFDFRDPSSGNVLCPGIAKEFMGRVFTLTFIPD